MFERSSCVSDAHYIGGGKVSTFVGSCPRFRHILYESSSFDLRPPFLKWSTFGYCHFPSCRMTSNTDFGRWLLRFRLFACLPWYSLFHRPLMRLFLRVWVGKHSKFSLPQHRSSKNPIGIDCSTGLNFGIVSAPRFGRRFWHGWPRSMNEYKSWCKHAQHEAFVVGARDKDIYCS